MAISFLTNLNEEEFKLFLKQSIEEILTANLAKFKTVIPDTLDVKQAAEFLNLRVTTLYEKTSKKEVPHYKKGNKLSFDRAELEAWRKNGRIKTVEEIRYEAATITLLNKAS